MPEDTIQDTSLDALDNSDNLVDNTDNLEDNVVDSETPEISNENLGEDKSIETTDKALSGSAIRNSVKKAIESNPELSKELKATTDAYFREQAYKKSFATPQEAAQTKELLDSIGGLDGLSNIQERIDAFTAQDNALQDGDPAVLDAFFNDFPEGAAALAPYYLEKLEKVNTEAFQNTIAPYAINMLNNSRLDQNGNGLAQYINAILNSSDQDSSKAYAATIMKWLNGLHGYATDIKNKNESYNPMQEKINKEYENINQQKEDLFVESVKDRNKTPSAEILNNEIAKYSKQYKLNNSQKKEFENIVMATAQQRLNDNETFMKQCDLRYAQKNRSAEKISQYIINEWAKTVRDVAFEKARSLFGSFKTTSSNSGVIKATNPQTSNNGGPIKISQRPPDDQIDWNKPEADLNLIKGRAWLKNGRFVTWK